MLNILYLYNASQTYTNAVYEHISSFGRYSKNHSFFCHQDQNTKFDVNLTRFDAIGIHFSVRLPLDQFSPSTVLALKNYKGLKFLFIQDEYDYTQRAWYWIKELGLRLVFTAVPSKNIECVYPSKMFPNTRFINVLTGYVPNTFFSTMTLTPTSQRSLIVGYRGRQLPIHYGQLGIEKVNIGKIVKNFCKAQGIPHDIAWTEKERIYGDNWYHFVSSCRSMLATESGSNVFDWDGTLFNRIATFRNQNPQAWDEDVYANVVKPAEIDGMMNQISPKVFEAIAAKTALVLYEGHYSGVLEPDMHYIPLKKDGSNIPEVIHRLHDANDVEAMAERAYQAVITSGRYSFKNFVQLVDDNILPLLAILKNQQIMTVSIPNFTFGSMALPLTSMPIKSHPLVKMPERSMLLRLFKRIFLRFKKIYYG